MIADQVIKWHKVNEIWVSAVVLPIEPNCTHPVPSEMQQLLSKFSDIFQESQTLPPRRPFDHAIHLIPGAAPVNSGPYRCSPLQKDEIEKQVKQMTEAGLITPSLSPFASPVLLVKKGGTWRFCIDYRRVDFHHSKKQIPQAQSR